MGPLFEAEYPLSRYPPSHRRGPDRHLTAPAPRPTGGGAQFGRNGTTAGATVSAPDAGSGTRIGTAG